MKVLGTIILCTLFSSLLLASNPVIRMETTKGDIIIELYPDQAPITVENMLTYVKDGFYNGTIFHRVIPNFMIQGGGFNDLMEQKTTRPPITNEATNKLPNVRGSIAMARTNVVDSATSQFFINTVDNGFLNHVSRTSRGFGYCVFGQVINGMDVVDAIQKVKTTQFGPYGDVPADPIIIKKASIILDGTARQKSQSKKQTTNN